MSLTFACVLRSGGVYNAKWVDRLYRQVDDHLNVDRFVCLSDVAECAGEALVHNWPGWYSKLELFRPGLFTGPVVYTDLDSLLLGPIPGLREVIQPGKGPLWMLDDFFNPRIPASGVMAWIPCEQTESIYHDFAAAPKFSTRWSQGDGSIIGRYPHIRLQSVFPGCFASYKAHKLQNTPAGFSHVSFHGKPKQNDFPPGHWVHDAWVGA